MLTISSTGCATYYKELRREGTAKMSLGEFAAARHLLKKAELMSPQRLNNLHDLGACSLRLAQERFTEMNQAAALREVDAAIVYFSRALTIQPNHYPSIKGKNIALELKGQFDEALAHAEWTAENVGPMARNYIFLAKELEERGDVDGALLRHRQAVAMEPENPQAHVAFARFLIRHDNEKGAVHHFKAAYRLNPLDEDVLDELARRGEIPTLRPAGQRMP